jgi:uncharacterized membrane protein
MTAVLTVVLLASSGIFAGGLVMVAGAIVPTFRALPPTAYVQLHQTLSRYVDRFMPATALLTIVVGLALTWLNTGTVRVLLAAGVLLNVAVAIISQFGNVPLNRKVRSWNPEAPPTGTSDLVKRWRRLHLLRTLAGVLALGVFAVAAVLRDAGQ